MIRRHEIGSHNGAVSARAVCSGGLAFLSGVRSDDLMLAAEEQALQALRALREEWIPVRAPPRIRG